MEGSWWVLGTHWPHLIIIYFWGCVTGGGESPKNPRGVESNNKWHKLGHKWGPGGHDQKKC